MRVWGGGVGEGGGEGWEVGEGEGGEEEEEMEGKDEEREVMKGGWACIVPIIGYGMRW